MDKSSSQPSDRCAFPGPLTLHESGRPAAWLCFGLAALVLVTSVAAEVHQPVGLSPWLGSAFLMALAILPGAFFWGLDRRLILSANEFEVVHYLWRRRTNLWRYRAKWADVSNFSVTISGPLAFGLPRMVARWLLAPAMAPVRMLFAPLTVAFHDPTIVSIATAAPAFSTIPNATLPGAYGLPLQALADLMNRWREDALAAPSGQ